MNKISFNVSADFFNYGEFASASALGFWLDLRSFLDQGGPVLLAIMLMCGLLFFLLLERVEFLWFRSARLQQRLLRQWQMRADKSSWGATKIRLELASILTINVEKNLGTIRLVILLAPLMGLLGTVTGMIDVFDVMAVTGSSNARSMAGGVSKATIPTMAGMVLSLLGMLCGLVLQRRAKRQAEHFANKLSGEAL